MTDAENTSDTIFSFLIDQGTIRGQAIRLGPCLDAIISQHAYPDAVGIFVAEAAALAALLSAPLKYDGTFTLQIQSEGAIKTLVVSLTSRGGLRGYVRFDRQELDEALKKAKDFAPVPAFFGSGSLAFTVEQEDASDDYQGVVGLEKPTLTECVLQYFAQSEQIQTAIRLHAAPPSKSYDGWRVGAVMIQRMPIDLKTADSFTPEEADELWRTAVILLNSAKDEELRNTTLPIEKLVNRLYHANDLHLFMPKKLNFSCRCSQKKVLDMLRRFPPQEQQAMVQNGKITVDCQFCGRNYILTPKDLESGD